jgi:DNA-directed RNA polymerase specialized sigma54-like protein
MAYILKRFNKRHQQVGLFYRADTKRFWWMLRGKEKLKEIIRPALKEIFKGKAQKSKDQVIYEVHLQYGYTLKEIAEYIGVHYSTVSRAIKKIEGEDEK